MIVGIDVWVIYAWAMKTPNVRLIVIKAGDQILYICKTRPEAPHFVASISISTAFPVTLARSVCRSAVLS